MIYAMSDIHGNDIAFFDMLKKINFTDDDILIICGDVIDRGAGGLEILDYCMRHENIHLIKGNHEVYLETYLEYPPFSEDWKNWGGIPTMNALKKKDRYTILEYYNYVCALPIYEIMEINGVKYAFTHTGFLEDNKTVYIKSNVIDFEKTLKNLSQVKQYSYLISTDLYKLRKNISFDCVLIVGHIPTISETFFKMPQPKIVDFGRFIDIDCGAGYEDDGGVLGCLRIDDMQKFYIK